MLVSIAKVGLVDNRIWIDLLYQCGAPIPVLYRDGKASFVGNEYIYRKLGMPVNENANICVETFQNETG